MASLFLSHSNEDDVTASWLADRLRQAGFEALYLDFDPEQGTPAGRDWEHELYSELRRTDAVVFLASAASSASRWCFTELALARSISKPIFPVAVDETPRHGFLDHLQWVSLRSESRDQAIRRLIHGLARAGLDPHDAFAWNTARSPYPGLDPFVAEDAAMFFGRGEEINRLLLLLQPTLQREGGRFVAVVGPSGSGKSSLVRAGVVPRLRRSPERWVVLPAFAPGRHPADALARGLARGFPAGTSRLQELHDRVGRGADGLVDVAYELCDLAPGRPDSVLIVLDQAEELITRTADDERAAFLELLRGALHDDSPVWVLAALRSEFLGASPDRAVAEIIDDTLLLEPLSRSRLPEVIERPAQRAGVDFEAGLVQRMVNDAEGGDALPLLAYTLRQLYERSRGRHESIVTFDDYDAIGGVEGALQRRADIVADELGRRGIREVVLPTLLKLATLERDGEPARRRVARGTVTEQEGVVLQAFIDARLLRSGEVGGQATVEVAHEALLRQWRPLREAIERSRRSLQMRSDLERLAADWHRNDRDESYLIRGERLVVLGGWSDEHPTDLSPLERDFVAASRRLATSELDASRRTNRRLRGMLVGLVVLLAAAGYLALIAREQTREARDQAQQALSQRLAFQVPTVAETQPDLSLLLGLESVRLADGAREEAAQSALLTALGRPHHIATQLIGHSDQVRDVAYMPPDGRILATASLDHTIRLWDGATGRPRGEPLKGHSAGVLAVAFSPDGKILASASEDKTLRLWNTATWTRQGSPLEGHTDAVTDVAFSPDSATLASASRDKTVRLWDARTGTPRGEVLRGHKDAVNAVAFSPDGQMLASASEDKTLRRWDVAMMRLLGEPLRGHKDAVAAVAFSPDGETLASGSYDQTLRLWDAATGAPAGKRIKGHTGSVLGVAFSADSKTLASASDDRSVRLWDRATAKARGKPVLGHTDTVAAVAFSPNGKTLASASDDRTARLWQISTVQPLTLRGHTDYVTGVAFSLDGKTIATSSGSFDRTLRLWDAATGKLRIEPIKVGSEGIWDLTYSPDGKTLALALLDGVVSLRDAATGKQHATLRGHRGEVWDVAFSPNGQTIATAGSDKTVRLWDAATAAQRGRPLRGHTKPVDAVAFSRDGKTLASGSHDGTVRLWDTMSGASRGGPLKGHGDFVVSVAFNPKRDILASGSFDKTVRLWDAATGRLRGKPLTAHTDLVADVAFSPDGRTLASGGFDRTVRLWDPATGNPRGLLVGHTKGVFDVAFRRDSRRIAAAGEDRTVRLWDIAPGALVAQACKAANRNLSRGEWERYLGTDISYERTCGKLPAGEGARRDAPSARY
jgi:WD40 repeat protein